MNQPKSVRYVGIFCILLAVGLRFAAAVAWGSDTPIFQQPQVLSLLLTDQTGRVPASTYTTHATTGRPSQTTAPVTTTQPPSTAPAVPVFGPGKAVKITYSCDYRPDLSALIAQPLNWALKGDDPTVLILHTHGTESYTPTPDTAYKEYGGEYRTDDTAYNLISLGDRLAQLLEQAGIGVIHDRTMHDKDDYLDAYSNARAAIQAHLKAHPSIRLVLDLHRDAAAYADGTQWATSATVKGEKSAQLMFVVGTDAGGNTHPNWQENLSVAAKLQLLLEDTAPGITRPIDLRSQRFNQDLSAAALIVEVGSAGNTHTEAMAAIAPLAAAIIALQYGSG